VAVARRARSRLARRSSASPGWRAVECAARSARGERQDPGGEEVFAHRQEQGREDRVRGDIRRAGRKAFAKLDTNGNGALSFDEWAAKTIDKFKGADADKSGWLTAAEYATTAPPPPKHPAKCQCQREAVPEVAEN
jgi:EF hand